MDVDLIKALANVNRLLVLDWLLDPEEALPAAARR